MQSWRHTQRGVPHFNATMNDLATEQTRLGSLIESLVNIAIGYAVALVSQLFLFKHYGIEVTVDVNLKIVAWFTLVSLVRSYALRRLFNGRSRKPASTAR